jgi:hypothetical protein
MLSSSTCIQYVLPHATCRPMSASLRSPVLMTGSFESYNVAVKSCPDDCVVHVLQEDNGAQLLAGCGLSAAHVVHWQASVTSLSCTADVLDESHCCCACGLPEWPCCALEWSLGGAQGHTVLHCNAVL